MHLCAIDDIYAEEQEWQSQATASLLKDHVCCLLVQTLTLYDAIFVRLNLGHGFQSHTIFCCLLRSKQ